MSLTMCLPIDLLLLLQSLVDTVSTSIDRLTSSTLTIHLNLDYATITTIGTSDWFSTSQPSAT